MGRQALPVHALVGRDIPSPYPPEKPLRPQPCQAPAQRTNACMKLLTPMRDAAPPRALAHLVTWPGAVLPDSNHIIAAVTNGCMPRRAAASRSLAGGAPAGAEDLAPLQAPLRKHLAPRRRRHAGPEPRHAGPFPVRRGRWSVGARDRGTIAHAWSSPRGYTAVPHSLAACFKTRIHHTPPAPVQRVPQALLVVGLDQERPAQSRQHSLHRVDNQVCMLA